MRYILYNPLSDNYNGEKNALKFADSEICEYKLVDLLQLVDKEEEFITNLDEFDDVVIIGGDGTLHTLANRIKNISYTNKIYYKACGSGNDFNRSHDSDFYEINSEISDLPVVRFNNTDEVFLNGVGMGVDAAVCKEINEYKKAKIKKNYLKTAIKCLFKFKKYNIDITIDKMDYSFKNVWFFNISNDKYIGGGMKVAPRASRYNKSLEVIVVYKMSLFKLLLMFPTIFLGKHTKFKKSGVFEVTANEVCVKTYGCNIMQIDGEIRETDEINVVYK